MIFKTLLNQYNNLNSFESLIKRDLSKGEEAYFGIDNPLRVGLIHHLTIIKELITKARAKNPSINGLELVDICEGEFEKLANIIEENFNVEKCAIGIQNELNAYCISEIYNKNVAGPSESSSKMRIKLDDIVETKNGFRYRDGKGIYYVVCIGLQFFYKDEFTIPEIAGALVHELGHAMQHIVHDINSEYAIAYWTRTMRSIDLGYLTEVNGYTKKILNQIKKSHISKDYDKLSRIGSELLNSVEEEDAVDFKSLDSRELTAMNNDQVPIDGDDIMTKPKKRNIIIRTFIGIIKAPLSIIFAIFLVPMMLYYKSGLGSRANRIRKNDEMIADSFEVFYGFGAEAGEFNRKVNKYRKIAGDQGLINYVPLLNLWKCHKDLKNEYMNMIFGYPSDKQRIVNAYINCDFELKNNKDLSENAKRELREQMDSLKDTYDKFVTKQDTKAGFIYRIASMIGANTIEKAAKQDPSLKETILEPLLKKRNAGGFK